MPATMTSVTVIILLLVLPSTVQTKFINDWDQSFDFKCQAGQVISYLYSVHNNAFEDRRWDFSCRAIGTSRECTTSKDYVNDYDKPVVFSCPGAGVITGISSINDNFYKDRRFQFTCCEFVSKTPTDCFTTANINDFDGEMSFGIEDGLAIKGMFSWHDNLYEDRRWTLKLCKI